LIEIGSKTAEKNSAQQTNKQTNRQTDKPTDKQTDRHYENNGHLAVNQKFGRAVPKGHKMVVKKWMFLVRNAFYCNGTDRHGIPARTPIDVLYRTLIEEFRKFFIKINK